MSVSVYVCLFVCVCVHACSNYNKEVISIKGAEGYKKYSEGRKVKKLCNYIIIKKNMIKWERKKIQIYKKRATEGHI